MIRTGIKILKKMGVCRESLWPYEIAKFKQSPDPACYKEGLDHQITGYQRLSTLAEMKACLAMGLPFVSGFSVYDSAMSDEVTRSGDVPMPGNRDILQGGHAIMAVGYDDLSSRFIFRNSWGEAWGQMGYGTLPYAFIADGLADDFWCIQTVESNQYACYKIKQDEAIV